MFKIKSNNQYFKLNNIDIINNWFNKDHAIDEFPYDLFDYVNLNGFLNDNYSIIFYNLFFKSKNDFTKSISSLNKQLNIESYNANNYLSSLVSYLIIEVKSTVEEFQQKMKGEAS